MVGVTTCCPEGTPELTFPVWSRVLASCLQESITVVVLRDLMVLGLSGSASGTLCALESFNKQF